MKSWLLRAICIAVGAVVVAAYGGTLIETYTVNDAIGVCTRNLDNDNSSWQNGSASMRWFPAPAVHCHFEATGTQMSSPSTLPEATEDRVAVLGIVLFFLAGGFLAGTFGAVWMIVGVANRLARQRADETRAD